MRSRPTWWFIFSAAALVVIAALVWVTCAVLNLEQRELTARAEARQQEALRLALWRMDSWLSPRLAREAARPYFEYQPYFAQQQSYTNMFNEIAPGQVMSPSPLLTFTSEYFPIHFQINADGGISSPQVPLGNERDLAESRVLTGEQIDANQQRLDELALVIDRDALAKRLGDEEARIAVLSCEAATDSLAVRDDSQQQEGAIFQQLDTPDTAGQMPLQQKWSEREYQQRAMSSNVAQQPAGAAAPQKMEGDAVAGRAMAKGAETKLGVELNDARLQTPIEVGPLVAMWAAGQTSVPRPLLFVRRVRIGNEELFQGFVADWLQIRAAMLGQINDLFPDARLRMTDDTSGTNGDPAARRLATVPAELITPPPEAVVVTGLTPARLTLGLTWLAVIGAIIAAGLTLHHSIAYAAKRSRFTSAVTHELRTPLTTFRMYSEMLAENMVRDEAQRTSYLQTLKSESARLANLVENVLAYARLEEGRSPRHAQTMTVEELLERVRPMLDRRATEAGLVVRIASEDGQRTGGRSPSSSPMEHVEELEQPTARQVRIQQSMSVDADAVGQILFNLVDNACKYASGPEVKERFIDITAQMSDKQLRITVRDHGPGIDANCARTIFRPFDRGRHSHVDASDTAIPIPGVGLGLALARGLARDLGGELILERPKSGPGAMFVLTRPLSR